MKGRGRGSAVSRTGAHHEQGGASKGAVDLSLACVGVGDRIGGVVLLAAGVRTGRYNGGMSLQHRDRRPEIMDDPALDEQAHFAALDGLARVNRFSGSTRMLWPAIRDLAREHCSQESGGPLRILDIATGGGDVPIGLWRRSQRAGIPLQIAGCDVSPRAVDYARRRAVLAKANVEFFILDALACELPADFDCLMCSLFLHHLTEADAELLLRKMAMAAGRMVLVNDLVRSTLGLGLVQVAMRLLTRSPVVHTDGPLSIRAAFTPGEARRLAERAGLQGAKVARRHPCRFLLSWRRQ